MYDVEVVIDFVKGLVVAIPVFERVSVTEGVYEEEVVIDFVKGRVVGIPDLERVCVTDCV